MNNQAPRPSAEAIWAAHNAIHHRPGEGVRMVGEGAAPIKKAASAVSETVAKVLPKGISTGKVAAYVAAAAVVAGGIHLLTRQKSEPEQTAWRDRVAAERAGLSTNQIGG